MTSEDAKDSAASAAAKAARRAIRDYRASRWRRPTRSGLPWSAIRAQARGRTGKWAEVDAA